MFLNLIIRSFKFTASIHNRTPPYAYVFQIIIIMGDILLIGGMIFALFQTREMIYLITIIATLFSICFGCSLRYLSKIYEKLLLRIISTVLSTHPDWPEFISKEICFGAESRTERNFGLQITLVFFTLTFCLFCPYFYLITKPGITLDHPDLQLIPYFYPSWKTKTLRQHLSKRFFEGLIAFSCMVGYFTFTAFMIYSINNLEVHIRQVNILLNNTIAVQVEKYMTLKRLYTPDRQYIYEDYILKYGGSWKQRYVNSTNEEFKKIIQYHRFIHR